MKSAAKKAAKRAATKAPAKPAPARKPATTEAPAESVPATTGGAPPLPVLPTLGNPLDTGLTAVRNAQQAADDCAVRARQIRIASLDPDVKAEALAEEVRATSLSGDCGQIEIDLKAAQIHIDALPDARIMELSDLSAKLDREIVARQLIDTGLDSVTAVLTSVAKVKDILSNPTIQV